MLGSVVVCQHFLSVKKAILLYIITLVPRCFFHMWNKVSTPVPLPTPRLPVTLTVQVRSVPAVQMALLKEGHYLQF